MLIANLQTKNCPSNVPNVRSVRMKTYNWKDIKIKQVNKFVDLFYSIQRKYKNAYWYMRGILWDRYHVLKCSTLPPTFNDRCDSILHFNFQILVDFCEKELEQTPVDDSDLDDSMYDNGFEEWKISLKKQRKIERQLWSLYDWWKTGRAVDSNKLDRLSNQWWTFKQLGNKAMADKLFKELGDFEQYFQDNDDAKLQELIGLRRSLWT